MLQDVATPKKPAAKKPPVPTPSPARADGRQKSLLTLAGEQAALEAKRLLLQETLRSHDWNLSHTAEVLRMGSASQVLRAIRETGLEEEYRAARDD